MLRNYVGACLGKMNFGEVDFAPLQPLPALCIVTSKEALSADCLESVSSVRDKMLLQLNASLPDAARRLKHNPSLVSEVSDENLGQFVHHLLTTPSEGEILVASRAILEIITQTAPERIVGLLSAVDMGRLLGSEAPSLTAAGVEVVGSALDTMRSISLSDAASSNITSLLSGVVEAAAFSPSGENSEDEDTDTLTDAAGAALNTLAKHFPTIFLSHHSALKEQMRTAYDYRHALLATSFVSAAAAALSECRPQTRGYERQLAAVAIDPLPLLQQPDVLGQCAYISTCFESLSHPNVATFTVSSPAEVSADSTGSSTSTASTNSEHEPTAYASSSFPFELYSLKISAPARRLFALLDASLLLSKWPSAASSTTGSVAHASGGFFRDLQSSTAADNEAPQPGRADSLVANGTTDASGSSSEASVRHDVRLIGAAITACAGDFFELRRAVLNGSALALAALGGVRLVEGARFEAAVESSVSNPALPLRGDAPVRRKETAQLTSADRTALQLLFRPFLTRYATTLAEVYAFVDGGPSDRGSRAMGEGRVSLASDLTGDNLGDLAEVLLNVLSMGGSMIAAACAPDVLRGALVTAARMSEREGRSPVTVLGAMSGAPALFWPTPASELVEKAFRAGTADPEAAGLAADYCSLLLDGSNGEKGPQPAKLQLTETERRSAARHLASTPLIVGLLIGEEPDGDNLPLRIALHRLTRCLTSTCRGYIEQTPYFGALAARAKQAETSRPRVVTLIGPSALSS